MRVLWDEAYIRGAVCAAMLIAPFVFLAGAYGVLPQELPVLRLPFVRLAAAKSAFIVFRVPLMNLIHVLMAAVMLSRARDFPDVERRRAYRALFATLILAIGLKSNFEALEFGGVRWAVVGTMGSVIAGVPLALVRGRGARMPWTELRLRGRHKIALVGLLAAYLAMVTASFWFAHRA